MNINDHVYIRPDLINFEKVNERGRITAIDNGVYWVVNTNMPYMGTISTWFNRCELSNSPWPEHMWRV